MGIISDAKKENHEVSALLYQIHQKHIGSLWLYSSSFPSQGVVYTRALSVLDVFRRWSIPRSCLFQTCSGDGLYPGKGAGMFIRWSIPRWGHKTTYPLRSQSNMTYQNILAVNICKYLSTICLSCHELITTKYQYFKWHAITEIFFINQYIIWNDLCFGQSIMQSTLLNGESQTYMTL